MKKDDIFECTIVDYTTEGEGIGKIDAFPLFIKDTVIGDRIRGKVICLKKNYGYGKLLQVLEPSEDRVTPRCPLASSCGGCQLQQVSDQAENSFKTRKVAEDLRKIGGFSAEIPASDRACGGFEKTEAIPVFPALTMADPWHYRNKAQVPFGYDKTGKLICGFYAGRTHDIMDVEDCPLAFWESGEILRAVKSWMLKNKVTAYREETHQGLIRHALIRKGYATGELLVCLIANGQKLPDSEDLLARLRQIPGFVTLCLNVNTGHDNVILGRETRTLYGPGFIEDKIGEVRFRISPESFFQVNPAMTEALYGKALEYAGLTGNETVWDVYCGIGTISLFLARHARKVYGVEIVDRAIQDARENAALNGLSNTEFFVGKAEEVLPAWYEAHKDIGIDVIVVDPPRKGCDGACLETILKMAPQRVVYVSCDPATLARDLRILADGGYTVEKVQPVNQFQHTYHVETVVLMSKIAHPSAK